LQPSTIEIVDELGLVHRLLALPRAKLSRLTLRTPRGVAGTIDLGHNRVNLRREGCRIRCRHASAGHNPLGTRC